MTLQNIVWLASFPKSGNTWARIFLANYLLNRPRPISLDDVHGICPGDAITSWHEKVAGGPIEPGNDLQTLNLRPKVLRGIAANGADMNLIKTHNQNDMAGKHVLIPPPLTRAAIYFVRNPLDVVLSYAAHYQRTAEQSVADLSNNENTIGGNDRQVRQWTGSWSSHVMSWTTRPQFPVHVMRYEDMLEKAEPTFGGMLKALGVPVEKARLQKAIKFSSFNQVAAQERLSGFGEKLDGQETFFRKGQAGQWKADLDPVLVDRIKADHGKMMQRFGYLP